MREITVRPIRAEDAASFLDLLRALDEETRFMMLEPGERTLTAEAQRQRLEALLESSNQLVFVAELPEGGLAGFAAGYGGAYRRNHRTVHIVAGVRGAYAGQGLGRRLFAALEAWARGWGARRLELTVMCHNERALALYQKMGFTIEGRLRASLQVDGNDVDEYIMSKILEATQ